MSEPVKLFVKWVSFIRLAPPVDLDDDGCKHCLIAIPLTNTEDEWLLICNTQALAEMLRTMLKGRPVDVSYDGIDKPAIQVKIGSRSKGGDFNEAALIATLIGAGFKHIEESERPWSQFKD